MYIPQPTANRVPGGTPASRRVKAGRNAWRATGCMLILKDCITEVVRDLEKLLTFIVRVGINKTCPLIFVVVINFDDLCRRGSLASTVSLNDNEWFGTFKNLLKPSGLELMCRLRIRTGITTPCSVVETCQTRRFFASGTIEKPREGYRLASRSADRCDRYCLSGNQKERPLDLATVLVK